MTDRPAFPDSLPVRSNLTPASPRAASATATDSNGTVKILLAFLIFGVLANLGLTLWLHRSHENAQIVEAEAKDARLIDEMVHVRSELAQAKAMAAQSSNDIGKLKMQYATIPRLQQLVKYWKPFSSGAKLNPTLMERHNRTTTNCPAGYESS